MTASSDVDDTRGADPELLRAPLALPATTITRAEHQTSKPRRTAHLPFGDEEYVPAARRAKTESDFTWRFVAESRGCRAPAVKGKCGRRYADVRMKLRGLLDEVTYAGPEHLDPRSVAAYDQKARFDLDAAEEVDLLRDLRLGSGSTLIDLGAGTGMLAAAAAPICQRVVAVDVSPQMIVAMRAKVTALGLGNVECVQAGFLSYEHEGTPADFVYSRNALHHLPDFWKAIALRNIATVLRPGGILRLRDIVFAFEPAEAERFIVEWLESGADDPSTGWTRAEFEEHLRTKHSTFTWLLEPMLERAGFEIRDVDYGPRRIYARYLCVRNREVADPCGEGAQT